MRAVGFQFASGLKNLLLETMNYSDGLNESELAFCKKLIKTCERALDPHGELARVSAEKRARLETLGYSGPVDPGDPLRTRKDQNKTEGE